MPKKGRGKSGALNPLSLPPQLQTALEALYGHYEKTYKLWQESGIKVPPCFIVICNNTSASKLVYDFISGFQRENDDASTTLENGRLHRENEKRLRQRTATIRREQTEKNATNKFEKSNYLNVLGFKHLVDIEGRAS